MNTGPRNVEEIGKNGVQNRLCTDPTLEAASHQTSPDPLLQNPLISEHLIIALVGSNLTPSWLASSNSSRSGPLRH